MVNAIRAVGWGASAYFVTLFILGTVLLNLFLAILLGNFDADEAEDEDTQSHGTEVTIQCAS